ncbi:hypothetical protein IRT45_24290 [Nocardia sp. BSTN01]|uniref:Pycsar system effector family protein n=1 Tax=Nocardia sp. BSTN01 TaxID=2783665 RepID=UPI00188F64EF|nr:Pycsar system effector family protein [Nocardia sp. BSTN01]MBF5000269.1 hypothetical protein [Nocardia sp. BSTN01]
MEIRRRRLGAAEDLEAALHAVSEFNRTITAADTKLGLLLTANGFALTGLVSAGRTPTDQATGVMAIVLEALLLICMCYLAAALRPTLSEAGPGNWFSFPTFPAEGGERPVVSVLADHAWRQAAVLAAIARRKYRRLAVALRWSALSLTAFLAWFTVVLLGALR